MPGVLSKEALISWIADHSVEQTAATYKPYAKQFREFCDEAKVPSVPASEETVASFLIDQFDQKKARSTINNVAYSAVMDLHRFNDSYKSLSSSPLIKSTKRSIAINTPAPSRKKPCTSQHLLQIMLLMDLSTLGHLRDYLMLLLAYKGFLRQDNVTSLLFNDIWLQSIQVNGKPEWVLFVLLEHSKTDQIREGHTILIGEDKQNLWKCPVAFFRLYLQKLAILGVSSNYFFFNLTSKSKLAKNFVNKYVMRPWCKKAGIAGLSSHSLRAGGVTAAIEAGVHLHVAARHGNWKSNAIFRYITDSVASQLSVSFSI